MPVAWLGTGVVSRTVKPVPNGDGLFLCGKQPGGTAQARQRTGHIEGNGTMTELIYYADAYLQEFDAVVTATDTSTGSPRVTLQRTAFYPGGGGQPADEGWLTAAGQSWRVTGAKKEGAETWYTLADSGDASAIPAGATVHGKLDWDRRYKLMRTHTAMHILCGVVWRDYGAQVTGGNMDPGQGRMDFEFANLSREMIGEIEARCNAEIAAARDIRTQSLPRDVAFQIPDLIRTKINLLPAGITEIRTVEIVGLDLQADGGTHVANTREVGAIKVVEYKSKGAINKRIYIELA